MSEQIQEVPSTTPDFHTETATKIANLFPEVVADGKIDVEALREMLTDDAEQGPERFGLFWPGKTQAIRAAQTPTTATLAPDHKNSINWDNTQNVFIEGENLEVLKILQKHYYGKIKMIYIDPPYNTGGNFIYPDNYADPIGTYLELTRQTDEGGKIKTNTESAGRFHSNWLNMMYPRLKLAKNLMSPDGMLAISIDEVELANLRNICDEIFGPDNFVGLVSIKTKTAGVSGSHLGKSLKALTEYLLLYRRTTESFLLDNQPTKKVRLYDAIQKMSREGKSWKYTSMLTSIDEGVHFKTISAGDGSPIEIFIHNNAVSKSVRSVTKDLYDNNEERCYTDNVNRIFRTTNAQTSIRERVIDACAGLDSEWISILYTPTKGRNAGEKTRLYFKGDQRNLVTFLSEVTMSEHGVLYKLDSKGTFWDDINYNNLKTEAQISFPNGQKPIELIASILRLFNDKNFTVLDFFAGSCTTAHAVLKLNDEDGGSRKFIMVQLPEPITDSKVRNNGQFQTIADLGRERIRLAGLQQHLPISTTGAPPLPSEHGFRAYKLVDTNFVKWNVSSNVTADQLKLDLAARADSSDDGVSPERKLTELILRLGLSLTEQISEVEIAGLSVFKVGDGLLLAYMDEHVVPSLAQLRELVVGEPALLVILEDAFQGNDELKANLVQECRTHGVDLYTA